MSDRSARLGVIRRSHTALNRSRQPQAQPSIELPARVLPGAPMMRAADVLAMQRTLGNRAALQMLQRTGAGHQSGCTCASCSGALQRKQDQALQRQSGHQSGCTCASCSGALQRRTQPANALQRRERSNAIGPQEGKQQFITALMSNPANRTLLNHIPSTGMGRFDAEYNPVAGQLIITVKPYFNYVGPWTDPEKQDFEQKFQEQTSARWSGQHQMQCTRSGWEDLVADVVVRTQISNDPTQAHFNININHQKSGDTYIGREQYTDPSKISSGQFAREDAPERPHDNKARHCELATHDADRIDKFLDIYGVKEVGFTGKGDILPEHQTGLQQAVAAINKTALPAAAPVPILVTGFDVANERGIFKKDKARQRADKVAGAMRGLSKNPLTVQTVAGVIAAAKREMKEKISIFEKTGDDNKGYKKGGYWHKKDLAALKEIEDSSEGQKVTVGSDRKWVQSYKSTDPYSILAHEFGHMLGNPDEYFGYGPELLEQKIVQLSTSGDPVKVEEAKVLAKQRGKINKDAEGERGEIQDKFGKLVTKAGQEIPEFTAKGAAITTSIMNAGTTVLGAHYATLWEALGKITSQVSPGIQLSDWKIV